MKKFLTWGLVAFLVFFVVYRSDKAADVTKSIGSGITKVLSGLGDFIANVAS